MNRVLPLVLLLAVCRQNDDPASAEELLAAVKAADYQSWARAPGYPNRTPSNAPHSDQVEIFVNDELEAALADGVTGEWPLGSIIVKDGYTDDGDLALTAVMEKREDGWFWAEYDEEGGTLYSGEPTVCTDCHQPGADYVRAFGFP